VTLEIKGVTTGYGRTMVVHDASITVPDGGVVAIMGHNGAGKSTLLRAVVGLLPVKKGTILYDGEVISGLPTYQRIARGIAYVPQGQQSFGQLTTYENLRLIADGRKNGPALIEEMLTLFPALRDLLSRPAGLLSGGQRQQLAIARALITEPRTLILDEPTEGIQPSVVADIEATILGLTRTRRLSLLLVEQHVGFALNAAQRYFVLESGHITASGEGGLASEAAVRSAMAI